MKTSFRLIRSIVGGCWHIHQASGIGLMPTAMKLLKGELQGNFDDEITEEDKLKTRSPKAERFLNSYHFKGGEPYISERETWYYNYFPIKMGEVLLIPMLDAIMHEDYCGVAGTKTMMGWYAKAKEDESIKAIIELKNSPGGDVIGTRSLADYKSNFPKPIIGLTEGLECSAAAYIGSTDAYKFALSKDCIFGSCGVMTTFVDWSAWYESEGVTVVDLYSKTSPLKNDAYRKALKGDFKGYTDGILFKFDTNFMGFMQENRPNISQTALNGADFLSEDALKNGLIDAIGTFEDAYNKALELANTDFKNNKQSKTMAKKIVQLSFEEGSLGYKAASLLAIKEESESSVSEENQAQDSEAETDTNTEGKEDQQASTDATLEARLTALENGNKSALAAKDKQIMQLQTQLKAANKLNPAAARSESQQEAQDPKAGVTEPIEIDGDAWRTAEAAYRESLGYPIQAKK